MKITVYSNFFNHHQLPFAKAVINHVGKENFTFVATEPVPSDRIEMGYHDMNKGYSFVLTPYDNSSHEQKARELLETSDVVLIGSVNDDYLRRRLKTGKITFKTSERYFKEGNSLVQIPQNFLSAMKHIKRFDRYQNFYYLCMSAYTAGDVNQYANYKNRTYKWGYFPEVNKYNIDDLMNRKKSKISDGLKHSCASILWVGRLIGLKHPEMAVDLAEELKNAGYSFKLRIIGNGILEKQLQAMIEEKKLTDYIEMLGVMSPEQVRKYMEEADIYLFTSDFHEGWGAVLNEAMNSGCAVVSSHAIGSVPFLVKDKINGLIYRNGDSHSLRVAVCELLDNQSKREALGREAYYTMEKQWNADNAVQRLLTLIEALKKGDESPFIDGVCSKAEILSNNWFE